MGAGIGNTLLYPIKGIIEVFGKEYRRSEIIMRPDKPNASQYVMNISQAKEELGYEPKYDYISMLKDIKAEIDKANR